MRTPRSNPHSGPSPAMIVALLALFVALGGSSYAAITLRNGSVESRHIAPGQVKRDDIGKNAVSSIKVADYSLLAKDFNPGQLPAGPQGPKGDAGVKGDAGPAGAPATKLFAAVGATGELSPTVHQGVVAATRESTGIYTVTFDRDVTGCVAVSDVGRQGDAVGSYLWESVSHANIYAFEPENVWVAVRDIRGGGFVDGPFAVAVFC